MNNYYYKILGLNGISFDTMREARNYANYCLREKDDYQSTAVRSALGHGRDIICRVNIYTNKKKWFNL